jgi:HNH/ENDO VII superfamily nuclease with conserved GHE residues
MSPAKPWHMGHKPGVELRKQQRSAFEQDLPRETWRDWQNDPAHYRPELPSSNTSHAGENHSDDYFGP